MADYLNVYDIGTIQDYIKIKKLMRCSGEIQRYRVETGFYTEGKMVQFCLTKDDLMELKAQIEEVIE